MCTQCSNLLKLSGWTVGDWAQFSFLIDTPDDSKTYLKHIFLENWDVRLWLGSKDFRPFLNKHKKNSPYNPWSCCSQIPIQKSGCSTPKAVTAVVAKVWLASELWISIKRPPENKTF